MLEKLISDLIAALDRNTAARIGGSAEKAAPAEKAAKAEKTEKTEKVEKTEKAGKGAKTKVPSADEVREVMTEYSEKLGRPKARSLIKTVGKAPDLASVEEGNRAALVKAAKEALAELDNEDEDEDGDEEEEDGL